MSSQEFQPAAKMSQRIYTPSWPPSEQPPEPTLRPSRFCLTGESSLQVRNVPIVAAAYMAFALFGAFVFAVVNVSWFMLIPLLGGLVASLVTVYFLHKRYKQRRLFELQEEEIVFSRIRPESDFPAESPKYVGTREPTKFDESTEREILEAVEALRKSLKSMHREKR